MLFESFPPLGVAVLRRPLGRANDVRKEDCREHSLRFDWIAKLTKKRLGLPHDEVGRRGGRPRVVVDEFRDLLDDRAGDTARDVCGLGCRGPSTEDQSGNPKRRQNVADVAVHHHPLEGDCRSRTCALAHVLDVPAPNVLVGGERRAVLDQEALEKLGRSPTVLDFLEPDTPFVVAAGPRIVGTRLSLG